MIKRLALDLEKIISPTEINSTLEKDGFANHINLGLDLDVQRAGMDLCEKGGGTTAQNRILNKGNEMFWIIMIKFLFQHCSPDYMAEKRF